MTNEEIAKDRNNRLDHCRQELEASLKTWEFALQADDMIGQKTRLVMDISFVDTHKYDAPVAQPEDPEILANLEEAIKAPAEEIKTEEKPEELAK